MPKVCPHCGTSLALIDDAFCPECRGSLEEARIPQPTASEGNPLRGSPVNKEVGTNLTIPGRFLILVTVVVAVVGPFLLFLCVYDSLPAGGYPLWFFGIPVWFGCVIFFIVMASILRRLGIPVLRNSENAEGPVHRSE
jgi:hypothetical protein